MVVFLGNVISKIETEVKVSEDTEKGIDLKDAPVKSMKFRPNPGFSDSRNIDAEIGVIDSLD